MAISNITTESKGYSQSHIGFVKVVVDQKMSGRLKVWIPELMSREEDETGWILCNYCSPFGGATNWRDISSTDYTDFYKTQTSYGFWAVPPDINNEVLVMFPNGDPARAIWTGCIFKEYMNHMVPAHAYSSKNKNVNGLEVPVAEYNKYDRESGDTANPVDPKRPWHKDKTEAIGNQGLIKDKIRGITTSSSMRESPSKVVGISTPGPLHETIEGARLGGSSFVMDDKEDEEYIALKTRSGAQVRIDESNGLIYFINKTGSSWIQMDEEGRVDIFGAASMSVRSQENINFRADKDIILEAGQNIYMKAAKDTDAELNIVGEDMGIGGNIEFHAITDMHTRIRQNSHTTIEKGNLHSQIQAGFERKYVKGEVDVILESNYTQNITGDSHITITGNEVKKTDGNLDYAVAGTTAISSSTISLLSSNINVDSSGNLQVTGVGIFAGTVSTPSVAGGSGGISSAGDIVSSSQSLNALFMHTHLYNPGGYPPAPTVGFGQPGSTVSKPSNPSPTTPEDTSAAKEVTEAQFKELIDKINILESFASTTAIETEGANNEIPDWWNRDFQDVKTIVERLMTYEPCPEHMSGKDNTEE